jgi:hypothetical protein
VDENSIALHIQLRAGDQSIPLTIPGVLLFSLLQESITGLLHVPDTLESEHKRLTQLVRTGIRGILLSFGPAILDMLYRSKDHPNPAKGDDLLTWYAQTFAAIGLVHACKQTVVIESHNALAEQNAALIIHALSTLSPSQHGEAEADSTHNGETATATR